MWSRLSSALAAVLLVAVACGDAAEPTLAPPVTAATTTAATSTTAPATTTSTTTAPATTGSPTTSAPTTSAPTTTTLPAATTTTEPGVIVISVSIYDGIFEGKDRYEVKLGGAVRIVVSGDVSDEVHVHGYDFIAELTPDSPAEFEFTADIPGIFEVELETARTVLFDLVVAP